MGGGLMVYLEMSHAGKLAAARESAGTELALKGVGTERDEEAVPYAVLSPRKEEGNHVNKNPCLLSIYSMSVSVVLTLKHKTRDQTRRHVITQVMEFEEGRGQTGNHK